MKKTIILILLSLLFMMNLEGKAADQTVKFIEDKVEPSDLELIGTTVQKYEKNLVKAVNDDRFSAIEPFVIPNSSLYNGQRNLVKQLYRRGIRERFIACEIIDCRMVDAFQYKVYVKVSVGIISVGKPEVAKEFQWIYTVEKRKSGFGLSDIEEWRDYQKYIDKQMESVKADGYYAMELMRYYGLLLTEAVNTLNITQIKAVSREKAVLETQKKIIINLRKMSSEYELSHYEFTPTDSTCRSCDVTLIYKSIQCSAKPREVTVKLQINLEEIRKCFSGYAVIAGMKEIR